jgi:hypothetical protein
MLFTLKKVDKQKYDLLGSLEVGDQPLGRWAEDPGSAPELINANQKLLNNKI